MSLQRAKSPQRLKAPTTFLETESSAAREQGPPVTRLILIRSAATN